jgi:hypothetical protein
MENVDRIFIGNKHLMKRKEGPEAPQKVSILQKHEMMVR